MSNNTRNGFWSSLVVHALFFVLLGLMVAWKHFQKEPEPVIFEIVELPAEVPDQSQESSPDLPAIESPDIAPAEHVKIPELDMPEPEPTPPPPQPKPKKTEQPKPKPKEQPKAMSAADFFKEHGKPKPTPPKPRKVNAPRIELNTKESLQRLLNDGASNQIQTASPEEQQALLAFIAKLRRQIEIAWNKPAVIEGTQMVAVVRVTVQPNGSLNPMLLVTPSGSRLFDQSILSAVRNTRNIGGPPTGRAETINYTFKLTER